MNETIKTLFFFLFAVALVVGAYLSQPKLSEYKANDTVGKVLFPQFTDPLAIKSLEIVKLDSTGERNDFHIVEVNNMWSIPSHDNYPADAKEQMGRVAEALTGLTVLDVIEPEGSGVDSIAFQTQYGVIDPTSDNILIGEGVGTKITLVGANNATLVNLIVGKEVASRQAQDMMNVDETTLRYVRIASQAPVYVVSIDASSFAVTFDQWIEKNLLDIKAFDIKEVFVDQYSFSVELVLTSRGLQDQQSLMFVGDMTFEYDGSAVGADKWLLTKWMIFKGQNFDVYEERQLDPAKELDTETLDSMVSALGDLKIVSVQKKPAELASALREGKTFENIELTAAMEASMQMTGFWLVEMLDLKGDSNKTKTQLLSNEGDIQLRMKNGIVYYLRFGDLTGTESEVPLEQFDSPYAMDGSTKIVPDRYLFITAEFDPTIIPLPELRPIPDIPDEADAEEREMFMQVRESSEKINQREQERYDADLVSGKKRASELSDRFADWYYVISDDVYKRIRLTEANVFRFKTPEGESPWSEDILNGLDLQNILGTPQSPSSTDHLRDLPGIDGIEE